MTSRVALIGGLVVSVCVLCAVWYGVPQKTSPVTSGDYRRMDVRIAEHNFHVRVPQTAAASARGLGGVTALATDEGMYWVYASPQMVTFWMQGMRIPLDFIWIRDGRVIGTTEQVPPPEKDNVLPLPLFNPPEKIERVLEVAAGTVARLHIQTGTEIIESPATAAP